MHTSRSRAYLLSTLTLATALGACANGDFGRLKPQFVTDDMHAWVGREAVREAGIPSSKFPLTDEERQLRDLAYPLIEPPFDRSRWYSIINEYGVTRVFLPRWPDFDPTDYSRRLMARPYRSANGRYAQLNGDIRNDVTRTLPFFGVAVRVLDLDRKREKSLAYVSGLTENERHHAMVRIAENTLVIAWVQRSLSERAESYKYALEHLVIATPVPMAVEVERSLTLLRTRIAENRLVATPAIAAGPMAMIHSATRSNESSGGTLIVR